MEGLSNRGGVPGVPGEEICAGLAENARFQLLFECQCAEKLMFSAAVSTAFWHRIVLIGVFATFRRNPKMSRKLITNITRQPRRICLHEEVWSLKRQERPQVSK
jgi:hypothetical protein